MIEGDNPILIHGPVAEAVRQVREIAALLGEAGIEYSLEGYDEAHQMVAFLP